MDSFEKVCVRVSNSRERETIPENIRNHYQDCQVAGDYDRVRFTSLAGRVFDWSEKRAVGRLIQLIRRSVADPHVLDLPCGTGRMTEIYLRYGLRVHGADISPQMLDVAARKLGAFGQLLTVGKVDLDDPLTFPRETFHVVSCIRLLHHFGTERRREVLKSLAAMSQKYVLFNCSLSTGYHRMRRRLKRAFGGGHSASSTTRDELFDELRYAQLRIVAKTWAFPLVSEDLVVLAEHA